MLAGGAANPAFCNLLTYDAARDTFVRTPTLQAAGNIDPVLGSFFPTDARIPVPAQVASQAGLPLVRQTGWGGGPNVSLGPQAGVVWGVPATPYTAVAGVAMLLSWHLGSHALDAAASSSGGVLVRTPSPAAFVPAGLTFCANVSFAARGGNTRRVSLTPTCLRYTRAFTAPALAGRAYTSPLVCHAVLADLAAGVSYNYTVVASVMNGSTTVAAYDTPTALLGSALPFTFNTAPRANDGSAYPLRWAVMSDVGETFNSSLTAQYIASYGNALQDSGNGRTGLDFLLNVGDFSYADNYGPGDTLRTCASSPCGTLQQKTDAWFTMWQPVLGRTAAVHAAGNHELEAGGVNAMRLTPDDGAGTYGVDKGNYPFQSFSTRTPNGAMPPAQWGDIWSAQYFSQDVGPVHLVVLNNYIPFGAGTPQHAWFSADVAAVDRRVTPWLVVAFHGPAYHTYYTHYKEQECFMSFYEPLFYQYRGARLSRACTGQRADSLRILAPVDFVFNGHVHAFERTHPVYQYQLSDCGPVYITIGDGGNIEGPYRNFVDDIVPGSNATYCEAAWAATLRATPDSNAANGLPPGYQSQVHPRGCRTVTYQRASGVAGGPGAVPDPRAPDTFYCQRSQPVWSAYRDPSFGFAGLTFVSDTQATYSWYRNVDQPAAAGAPLRAVDTATYTRFDGACDGSPAPRAPDGRRSRGRNATVGVLAALFAVLVLATGAAGAWWWRSRSTASPALAAAEPTQDDDAPDSHLLRLEERHDTREEDAP